MPSQPPPTQDAMKTITWTKRQNAAEDIWDYLSTDGSARGYVSKYAGSDGFNWQAIRGGERVSGSAPTSQEGMAAADAVLALSIEQFNVLVTGELLKKIQELEQRILSIRPETPLLPGYQAGYAAGLEEARRRVTEALAPEAK